MEMSLAQRVKAEVERKIKELEENLKNKKRKYEKLILQRCDEHIKLLVDNQRKKFYDFRIEIEEVDNYSLLESTCNELGFTCHKEIFGGSQIYYLVHIPSFDKDECTEYTVAQKKYLEYEELLNEALSKAEEIILEKCESIKALLEEMKFNFNIITLNSNEKKVIIEVNSDLSVNSSYDEFFVKKYFDKLGFKFIHCIEQCWEFEFKED